MGDQKPTANELSATKRAIIRYLQGETKRFTFITPALFFDGARIVPILTAHSKGFFGFSRITLEEVSNFDSLVVV